MMTPGLKRLHAPRGIRRQRVIRQILLRAGYRTAGLGGFDAVAGWGRKPSGLRAAQKAARTGAEFLALEDGFIRSVGVGVDGAPPFSLIIDRQGIYYDATQPSDLETLLLDDARLDDPALLARATAGIGLMRDRHLSKYNLPLDDDARLSLPNEPFVLVLDQTAGDTSLIYGMAAEVRLADMVAEARQHYPGRTIVVRQHPDVTAGKRAGLGGDLPPDIRPMAARGCAWPVIEAAEAVFTASSLGGVEALMAGKPVHVFGMPFYAGWGLTHDRQICARRTRTRSLEQVFAAAYLLYPTYYDPFDDRLTTFERVAEILDFQKAQDGRHRQPTHCLGMSLWKQRTVTSFLGSTTQKPRYHKSPAEAVRLARDQGGRVVVWASRASDRLAQQCDAANVPLLRMEDGFIRSRGLGSDLVQPSSLVLDAEGIYYDPRQPSALETMIRDQPLTADQLAQAAALRRRIVAERLSKYNVGDEYRLPDRPTDRICILVPGQVANDASVRYGAAGVADNLSLLAAVRAENPDAYIVYKPHPDVEAGNRAGYIAPHRLLTLADCVAGGLNSHAVLDQIDEVWTMTSLMGFEGLIRDKRVVCFGMPFYAGWGLTDDRMSCPRRGVRRSLDIVLYCALVRYAAYTVSTPSGLRLRADIARLMSTLADRPPA